MVRAAGIFLFTMLLAYGPCHAQIGYDTLKDTHVGTPDTLMRKVRAANAKPSRVALFSAVLPGSGQIMNGQWWKVPMLYAGFATTGYFVVYWNRHYIDYRDAYRIRVDGDPNTIDRYDPRHVLFGERYSDAGLQRVRDEARRNRDLSYILAGVAYFSGILDAYVYAHLKDFDVSDDLSIQIRPAPMATPMGMGGGLTLNFTLKCK